ncbi:MAG: OsmC family protein [Limisphaerales bacterium]
MATFASCTIVFWFSNVAVWMIARRLQQPNHVRIPYPAVAELPSGRTFMPRPKSTKSNRTSSPPRLALRIGSLNVDMIMPSGFSEARMEAVHRAALLCPVKNTLKESTVIDVRLQASAVAQLETAHSCSAGI